MRTVTLEDHFTTPEVLKATAHLQTEPRSDFAEAVRSKLLDMGPGRIADMDSAGIGLQVLSLTNSGLDKLEAATATALAHNANDELAAAVRAHPDRLAGFAALALQEPEAAAAEFERCVNQLGFKGALVHGTVNGVFLDHPRFTPLFETANRLEVPLYLHPTPPPKTVQDVYYGGLPGNAGFFLARAAWGWHVELGMHCLRLILSGLFDRFHRLKIIIGHMGENLPYSIARADTILLTRGANHLPRRVGDYFHEHFYLTTSGYFTVPPFLCALQVVGADRILFSVDYPFSRNSEGRDFLNALPVGPEDREKIAHGNAERLLKL